MSEEFSNDSVTEVTTTGWLQRVLGSLVGALIGILMVIGSVILLWWNEGRAVEAIRALDQGSRQIVEAKANAAEPANDGKLVHLSGLMETEAPARDAAFGIGGDNLLRLKRAVEMFQWTEHKSTRTQKNLGGSETTETTYSYRKEWADHPVDSSHFHEADGHRNGAMPVRSATIDSQDVRLGAYRVDRGLLDEVWAFGAFDPVPAASLPAGYRKDGDMLYRGDDSAVPALGDIRIRYAAVPAQTISVVPRRRRVGAGLGEARAGDGRGPQPHPRKRGHGLDAPLRHGGGRRSLRRTGHRPGRGDVPGEGAGGKRLDLDPARGRLCRDADRLLADGQPALGAGRGHPIFRGAGRDRRFPAGVDDRRAACPDRDRRGLDRPPAADRRRVDRGRTGARFSAAAAAPAAAAPLSAG